MKIKSLRIYIYIYIIFYPYAYYPRVHKYFMCYMNVVILCYPPSMGNLTKRNKLSSDFVINYPTKLLEAFGPGKPLEAFNSGKSLETLNLGKPGGHQSK